MYIIGRTTTWPLTATGRSLIACRPRMPTCGGLRIGVLMQRAEHAAVGDAERAALEILERQRAVLRRLREVADRQLDLRRTTSRSASRSTGHHQTFGRADGHADVVVVLQDHLVALDLGVEARKLPQRGDRRP